MKLIPPIQDFTWQNVSQLFGVNRKLYLTKFNTYGHGAIDITKKTPYNIKNGYGTKIVASHNGIVIKQSLATPDRTKGNGLVLRNYDGMETIYWHLADFVAKVGQIVKQGEVIALMGNTGFVMPPPTKTSPYNGTHVHWGLRFYNQGILLNTQYGHRGYVNPVPYIYKKGDKFKMRFYRDLFYGRIGDDVGYLQTILQIEGFGKDYMPTSFFGLKTLRDTRLLQKKHGIPATGYVGRLTRAYLKNYQLNYYI